MHKSKGLEYPVVYCPYLWDGTLRHKNDSLVVYHDPSRGHRPRLELDALPKDSPEGVCLDSERRAENMRLAYVALTRAKHRVSVVWGPFRTNETSPLATLLHAPDPGSQDAREPAQVVHGLAADGLRHDLGRLARDNPATLEVRELADVAEQRALPARASRVELSARATTRRLSTAWRTSSFSGLVAGGRVELGAPVELGRDVDVGTALSLPAISLASADDLVPLHAFPRGAKAGDALHELFETLDFQTRDHPSLELASRRVLERHGIDPSWAPSLAGAVLQILATPLGPGGLRLADVAASSRVSELEFTFPVVAQGGRVSPRALASAFSVDPRGIPARYPADLAALEFMPLEGYLRGFIDLVFEHAGKVWVVDYKSNFLGARPRDYLPGRLVESMTEHHYFLQYHLYTLAVVRHFLALSARFRLRARLWRSPLLVLARHGRKARVEHRSVLRTSAARAHPRALGPRGRRSSKVTPLLATLRQKGWLAALDTELARGLGRLVDERDPLVLLGVALASRQIREGHVCADLSKVAGLPIVDAEGLPVADARFPEQAAWLAALRGSRLVGDGQSPTPLVLDGEGRLYLARYFQHERELAQRLLSRVGPAPVHVPAEGLGPALRRLFGPAPGESDAQRTVAMLAVLGQTTIVSGGPGTGKTTTVVKLLALLVEHGLASRIALLAPTGKAAARLSESVARAKSGLPVSEAVRAGISEEASTIHRALGPVGGDGTRFRHGREQPLSADVVVVDESSMVDVALMRRLLDAVPDSARLILLGDAHQLASVEAGAVLGDICAGIEGVGWSEDLAERAQRVFGEPLPVASGGSVAPLRDSMVELTKSYRFDPQRGIGGVAAAIRQGDADAALELLGRPGSEATLVDLAPEALEHELTAALIRGYTPFLSARTASAALVALERFRVLAAHRRGSRGVDAMNALAEHALSRAGLLPAGATRGRFYPRRPLLVTENDYQLGLFNGDVGVIFPGPDGSLRAHFALAEGGTRDFSPSRLPAHETVFATSIHKSQGSEFDEVVVVLPDERSPLLSRELVYTAVTRARHRAALFGSAESFRRGVTRSIERASGLRRALWGSSE